MVLRLTPGAKLVAATHNPGKVPEIAALLEIPEPYVRQRVYRARQVLREKLGALLEGKHAH